MQARINVSSRSTYLILSEDNLSMIYCIFGLQNLDTQYLKKYIRRWTEIATPKVIRFHVRSVRSTMLEYFISCLNYLTVGYRFTDIRMAYYIYANLFKQMHNTQTVNILRVKHSNFE